MHLIDCHNGMRFFEFVRATRGNIDTSQGASSLTAQKRLFIIIKRSNRSIMTLITGISDEGNDSCCQKGTEIPDHGHFKRQYRPSQRKCYKQL